MGRRRRAILSVALVVAVALSVLYWQLARFPAEVEPLAGTPFVLQVQRGVPADDLDQIRSGLRVMDAPPG